MAKTVDNYSTIEEFRQKYNELAVDVGEVTGLRPALGDTLVDAVNAVEDKAFYFGKYRYTATANQQTFTGADANGNVLKYKGNRVQVFKNGALLEEQNDWQVGGLAGAFYYNIQLISPATAGDLIQIYAYTGSFEGTATSTAILSFFTETLQNTIYNTNSNGVILQGDNSTPTVTLQGGYNLQLAGRTYAEEDITIASGGTLTAPTITDGTATLTSGSISGLVNVTASGELEGGSLDINGVADISGNTTIGGTLDVTGGNVVIQNGLTVNADVTLGDASGDNITVNGSINSNLIPSTNNASDLGSSSKKWNNLHATAISATTLSGNLTGNVTGNTTGNHIGDVYKDDGTTKILENSTGALTGTVSSVSNHDLSGLSDVNYTTSPAAGQVLAWDASNNYWEPVNPTNTTDSVSEGSNNYYFTDTRVNAIINAEAGLSKSYSANTGSALDGDINISVNTSEGIKIDGDNVVMDKTITGTAPSGVGSTSSGHLWFVV